jgi:tol-pal system protein YbgF
VRTRSVALAGAAMITGAMLGSMLAPRPTGAVSKEMIQLQEQISQLLQGQQSLRSAVDSNNASLRTLVQQSLDQTNALSARMDALQKSVGESSANDGAKIDGMASQTQGISDNVQDVQGRVGKLAAQMNELQGTLQSIDGRLAGGAVPTTAPVGGSGSGAGAPPPAGGASNYSAPATAPPAAAPAGGGPAGGLAGPASDTLYQNALRDFTTGKYDMAQGEFGDYVKNYPNTDLASNAQFYIGEISYQQGDYKDAITQYNLVLNNYPQSYKLSASLLKKGMAELELGMKATGIRDLKEVVRRFPGSDESRRASAKLKELGVSATAGAHTTR